LKGARRAEGQGSGAFDPQQQPADFVERWRARWYVTD
jgi:hypothetical protein